MLSPVTSPVVDASSSPRNVSSDRVELCDYIDVMTHPASDIIPGDKAPFLMTAEDIDVPNFSDDESTLKWDDFLEVKDKASAATLQHSKSSDLDDVFNIGSPDSGISSITGSPSSGIIDIDSDFLNDFLAF